MSFAAGTLRAHLDHMSNTTTHQHPLVAALLGLTLVGCGDASPEADRAALQQSPLGGLTARLGRLSSECEQRVFDGMLAVIGEDMEFPSEGVAAMRPPCEDGAQPRVDVYLVGDSLIFDFASADESTTFSDGGFDGYEIMLEHLDRWRNEITGLV